MKSVTDLLIGLVLAESVYGPDGSRNPANESDLQDQAEEPGQRSADGEEGKPGKKKRDDEPHRGPLFGRFLSF